MQGDCGEPLYSLPLIRRVHGEIEDEFRAGGHEASGGGARSNWIGGRGLLNEGTRARASLRMAKRSSLIQMWPDLRKPFNTPPMTYTPIP